MPDGRQASALLFSLAETLRSTHARGNARVKVKRCVSTASLQLAGWASIIRSRQDQHRRQRTHLPEAALPGDAHEPAYRCTPA